MTCFGRLAEIINLRHPLVQLAGEVNWNFNVSDLRKDSKRVWRGGFHFTDDSLREGSWLRGERRE
jgi:hypothetical protein